eukprot:80993-Chlamydomonas_euryale.AAC.1
MNCLVVHHVLRRRAELLVALDDLVNGVQKVLLGDGFATRAHSKHARLCAHRPQVGARRVGAQAREQLVADVALARHRAGVDLEDLRAGLQVWEAELDLRA